MLRIGSISCISVSGLITIPGVFFAALMALITSSLLSLDSCWKRMTSTLEAWFFIHCNGCCTIKCASTFAFVLSLKLNWREEFFTNLLSMMSIWIRFANFALTRATSRSFWFFTMIAGMISFFTLLIRGLEYFNVAFEE